MPQAYSKIYVHTVFSTKYRLPLIHARPRCAIAWDEPGDYAQQTITTTNNKSYFTTTVANSAILRFR